MCGIAGIIDIESQKITDEFILKFGDFNKFRGPDSTGIYSESYANKYGFSFIHHRLSIVDLNECANQPMISSSWVLVFNGEVYNFLELRKKLEKDGVHFSTNSDTEVILQLLKKYEPEQVFSKLDGMFAIAAFNKKTKKAYLARDKWGKKPLYYFGKNDHFSFSSDLRSFSKLNDKFTINTSGLNYYFSELSFPQPQTVFNEIKQVLPGCMIEISDFQYKESCYANLFEKQNTIENPQNIDSNVKDLIEKSVKKRQVADVNVGAFLSGGIDSSLIVSMASKNIDKLNTYTAGFSDKKFDERPFAQIIAKKYNTNHHEILIDVEDVELESLILEFGEPFADSSMIPSYLISKEVTKNQKAVLSGDGGDELFCGNATYSQGYRFDKIRNQTKLLRPISNKLVKSKNQRLNSIGQIQKSPLFFAGRELYRNLGFKNSELKKLFKNNQNFSLQEIFEEYILSTNVDQNDIFGSIFAGSIRTRLLNDYLVKIDRTSMYASLEVRSPFLDDELFNYINTLKKEQLMPQKRLKGILKDLAVELLPSEIINKPKTGFEIPIDKWLKGKWKNIFVELVLEKQQNLVELNYNFIKELWDKHQAGESHGHKLYAILVFHIWTSNYSKL